MKIKIIALKVLSYLILSSLLANCAGSQKSYCDLVEDSPQEDSVPVEKKAKKSKKK